jgi:hypothetical protein
MEEAMCPLCCEPLELADLQFLPCDCGYQVRQWRSARGKAARKA